MARSSAAKTRARRPVHSRLSPPERPTTRGRNPSKPVVIVYREGRSVVAALIHPVTPDTLQESAAGPHTALGMLRDKGWDFGPLQPVDSVPEWARQRVPKHCAVLGYATITSAPFR